MKNSQKLCGTLHLIATGHAMNAALQKEPWRCQCLACKFAKEFKLFEEEKRETFADNLILTLQEEGYKVIL